MLEFTLVFVRQFLAELVYAGPILAFLILLTSAVGYAIGKIEGWSKFDAFYHAVINATTVGYGDLHPTKKSSKMLAIANAFLGLVFFGIVVALALYAFDHAFKEVSPTSECIVRAVE